MGFLLVYSKNTDKWITNTDVKKTWEENITISSEQVLGMKQSKSSTTGLDAKQGMLVFFVLFFFPSSSFLFSQFSSNSLVKQTRRVKPLNFYICHVMETCMGRMLGDACIINVFD